MSRPSTSRSSRRPVRTTMAPIAAGCEIQPLEPRILMSAAAATPVMPDAGDHGGGASAAYAPNAKVAGKSLEQWSADYWKWALSFPVAKNPAVDQTGAQAFRGDVGDAFMLAGAIFLNTESTTSSIHRTVTIPAGTPILVPVLPTEEDNADNPQADGTPSHFTVPQLRDLGAQAVAGTTEVHASVDGHAVRNVSSYHEVSPAFSYNLPAKNNILQAFGLSASGRIAPAVADGFYLMLKGLTPGHHVIEFGGTAAGTAVSAPFQVDITYDVTVLPEGHCGSSAGPSIVVPPKLAEGHDGAGASSDAAGFFAGDDGRVF